MNREDNKSFNEGGCDLLRRATNPGESATYNYVSMSFPMFSQNCPSSKARLTSPSEPSSGGEATHHWP